MTTSLVTARHRRACVVLQPGIEMATACANPSHLAASIMPCLKASGYTCAARAALPHCCMTPTAVIHTCPQA